MHRKLSICTLLVLALSGCSGGETNVAAGNRDGVLHFGNHAEPQGLDPHVVSGLPELHIMLALFEGLVQKHPHTLEVLPAAAESWTVSEDGRVYTFTLQEKGRWSNGDPVTAYDFVWSWRRSLLPALGNKFVFMLFPVKNAEAFFKGEIEDFNEVGAKALDERTFQVTLNSPTPYFLQMLDHYSTYAVHRATVEAFGKEDESYTQWTRPENIVSNGPFLLKEWYLNRYLLVERNPDYWAAEQVKLNAIKYYPVDNIITEERMFRAGQLHLTEDIPIERIPFYQSEAPELIFIEPYAGTYLYRINTRKTPLNDVRIRRALAMTLDRDTLIATVLNGIFTPAYAVVPEGLLGYQPPQRFNYDPEGARRLLAEAGFPNGAGFPELELQYNSHDQHRKIATAVQQMWAKELNIDIRLQNKDWKVYLSDETSGNYDISRGGWIADYLDPSTFVDMWISSSGANRTGWESAEYDQLVTREAPRSANNEQRFEKFHAAESLLIDAMPIIPIYTYNSKHLRRESVKGIYPNLMDHYNFRFVHLDASAETSAVVR